MGHKQKKSPLPSVWLFLSSRFLAVYITSVVSKNNIKYRFKKITIQMVCLQKLTSRPLNAHGNSRDPEEPKQFWKRTTLKKSHLLISSSPHTRYRHRQRPGGQNCEARSKPQWQSADVSKAPRRSHGERTAFSTNGAGTTGQAQGPGPLLYTRRKS